jgi:hypothetical protein
VRDLSTETWRQMATDWRIWLIVAVCVLIATLAWLGGYD